MERLLEDLPSEDYFLKTLYRQHYPGEDEYGFPPWAEQYRRYQPLKAPPKKPQQQVSAGDTVALAKALKRSRFFMTKSAASKREDEVLLRMLKTPPKPHEDMKVKNKAVEAGRQKFRLAYCATLPVARERLSNSAAGIHRRADMMGHEPGRLVGNAKHAGQPMPGNVLLAAAKQMVGMKPDIQGNFRAFKDRAHGHAEGLPAGIAPANTGPCGVAFQHGAFVSRIAMRANRTVRPQQPFQMPARGIGMGEAHGIGWARLTLYEQA